MRGHLYKSLKAYDTTLFESLHADRKHKPVAISAMHPPNEGVSSWHWFVSILDDDPREDLASRVGAAIIGLPNIEIGRTRFSATDAYVRIASYDDLLGGPTSPIGWRCSFDSPTQIRRSRNEPPKVSRVWPDPSLLLVRPFQIWGNHGTIPPPLTVDELAIARAHLCVNEFTIRTEPYVVESVRRPDVGFVGDVEFGFVPSEALSPPIVAGITALLRLAEFCGMGDNTMAGMGRFQLLSVKTRGTRGPGPQRGKKRRPLQPRT